MNSTDTKTITLDQCDDLIELIRSTRSRSALSTAFQSLFDAYGIISYGLRRGDTFWRGRKCSDGSGYTHSRDLAYTPASHTTRNRLNDERLPIFYAATRKTTVLTELDAIEGDHVHLIGVRIKSPHEIRFIVLGELLHTYKLGYPKIMGIDPNKTISKMLDAMGMVDAKPVLYLDAFLSELLADPNAKEQEYRHTRVLIQEAFRKIPEAEGVFYPSVRDHVGMNIAIKPTAYDDKVHIVSSQVIRITRKRSFGFYDYERARQAARINDEGEFVWLQNIEPNKERFFHLTQAEAEGALKYE